jgi:hypothetical protein
MWRLRRQGRVAGRQWRATVVFPNRGTNLNRGVVIGCSGVPRRRVGASAVTPRQQGTCHRVQQCGGGSRFSYSTPATV